MKLSPKEKTFTFKILGLLFLISSLFLFYYGIAYSIFGGNLKFNYFFLGGAISFIVSIYLFLKSKTK